MSGHGNNPSFAGVTTITQLRKRNLQGELYARPLEITDKLITLVPLPWNELTRRSHIDNRADPEYVPSECLLYFLRGCRADSSGHQFEELYRILSERILRSLPSETTAAGTLSLRRADFRDNVFDRFLALLAKDRHEYVEKLDFFEVRFDKALRGLRLDALERVRRDENRSVPLDDEESGGEPSAAVENAAGSLDLFTKDKIAKLDYRSALDAAIESLPILQQRILELWRKDIPFDSTYPEAQTMAKILNKSDKTVRTHFAKACDSLKRTLTRDDRL